MSMKELLKNLSEACGASGFEYSVQNVIKKELEGHVSSLTSDSMGNLIAVKGEGDLSLMVAAHMDELGLIVKHIDDKGFIRFAKLGGVPDHVLLGKRVRIHTSKGMVEGVIGCKAIHVMKEDERKQLVTYDKMFIDIGAHSLNEAQALGVKVGDPITIYMDMFELGGDLVCGKAFDDRAGCAVLIELLRRIEDPPFKLYGVFTVQEEVGLKGATVSAFALNPTVGVAVDTTIAADHPGAQDHEAPVKLGKGPVILVADGRRDSLSGGLIANAKVREWLVNAAERASIPYQLEVLEGGTTDATAIHLSQRGIPAGVLSIPSRYTHSFSEVVSLNDLENCVKLLVEAVKIGLPSL
mgnify:CR=1 FL=1